MEITILKIIIIFNNILKSYLIENVDLIFLKDLFIIIIYFGLILIEKYSFTLYFNILFKRAYLIRVINKLILLRITIRDKL